LIYLLSDENGCPRNEEKVNIKMKMKNLAAVRMKIAKREREKIKDVLTKEREKER